ncbi:hypothetical protein PG990_001489 [Apiospora arundinis]|uniref:Uncharacterized protein n=1 Tax=Apiospora arundinis TaxID=335852 RepID=A0ABR2I2S2_9PEZI
MVAPEGTRFEHHDFVVISVGFDVSRPNIGVAQARFYSVASGLHGTQQAWDRLREERFFQPVELGVLAVGSLFFLEHCNFPDVSERWS